MKIFVLFFLLLGVVELSFAQNTSSKFIDKEVTLTIDAGNLFGSLLVADSTKKTPVVLLIPGSGQTNRDGNSFPGLNCNMMKMLAYDLAENGISSLRIDKRTSGKSLHVIKNMADIRFDDFISDACGWTEKLNQDSRFAKVIVFGHSQGSLIGMIAAHQKSADAFISVAGPGQAIQHILKEQFQKLPDDLRPSCYSIIDSLASGNSVKNVPPRLLMQFNPAMQGFWKSWMKYNPSQEIAKLSVPVLIVQGTTDLQVKTVEAQILAAAQPKADVEVFENMNHVLKEVRDDLEKNRAAYINPTLPLKDGLVKTLVNFIKSVN